MNLILGRSKCASKVFGTAAPDTGNSEILAHYGTPEQKEKYLGPLINDKISSCYSMTEPHGGADPTQFVTAAVQQGGEWVINGAKLWSSSAKYAAFYLVLAVTDPGASRHSKMSMFIVPADTPGVKIERSVGVGIEEMDLHDPERGLPGGDHGYVTYTDVRIPLDHLLGNRGEGFLVAQTRLSGGRIHYGMRTIGICKRALDMMCERAKSRTTQGESLSNKQMVQEKIADSWMELEQFKLLVLRTAWLIDQHPKDYKAVRKDIAAVKVMTPRVIGTVCTASARMHGGLGVSETTCSLCCVCSVMHSRQSCVADVLGAPLSGLHDVGAHYGNRRWPLRSA
jgi:acyl-CoA dehydrogenase